MVKILVNDKSRNVPDGTTVAELLTTLQIEPRHVAVEINLDLVPRAQHAEHELHEDDALEIVTLVGGG